jgi:hypothetical protein
VAVARDVEKPKNQIMSFPFFEFSEIPTAMFGVLAFAFYGCDHIVVATSPIHTPNFIDKVQQKARDYISFVCITACARIKENVVDGELDETEN